MESSKYAPAPSPPVNEAAEHSPQPTTDIASQAASQHVSEPNGPAFESTPAHPAPPIIDAAPAQETMDAMMHAAPPATYDADQFAQTVDTDDLFDDDFEPLAEPAVQAVEPEPVQEQPQPQTQTQHTRAPRAPRSQPTRVPAQAAPVEGEGAAAATSPPADGAKPPKATPAVRGDRSLTGGTARTKLTDDELSAKIEAMKLKNTALEEAHARAAADEAAFRLSEQAARERARRERQERMQMMGEREKNRDRKLKAMKSRDWDMEKQEQDERRGGSRRGAHGGIAGGAPVARHGVEGWLDDQANQPGVTGTLDDSLATARGGYARGGRGRGRGGRGGRGRSGLSAKASMPALRTTQLQSPPRRDEFPALPVIDNKHKEGTAAPAPATAPAPAAAPSAKAAAVPAPAQASAPAVATAAAPAAATDKVKTPKTPKIMSWADHMDD